MGKQFVLDTNVLLHNPQSLMTFGEANTVVIPIVTIEELDRFKTHLDAIGANARAAIRLMDQVSSEGDIVEGAPLPTGGTLRIELNHQEGGLLPKGLDIEKADHRILAVAAALQQTDPDHQVVLVSNDFNLRVKARSMGIRSEAYRNDQVGPVDHSGIVRAAVPPALFQEVESDGVELVRFTSLMPGLELQESDYLLATLAEPCARCKGANARKIVYYSDPPKTEWLCAACLVDDLPRLVETADAFYSGRPKTELSFGHGHVALQEKGYWEVVDGTLRPLSCYRPGQKVYGSLDARNDEQVFALDALLNPKKALVTLLGPQGSGKTLLAIAVGMELTERQAMEKVVYTREIVPMGRDLGALPGTEEEKMREWVMPAYDALEALFERPRRGGHGARAERETLEDRVDYLKRQGQIEFKSISFFRGRSFSQRFLILDEAQNVTPHQAAITVKRAGKGTKVILIGDPEQIDSPYLSRGADGLSFIAQKMRGQDLFACVQLESAERSPLAERCRQLGL
ncbi:MAG: PhoH family protein [Thermaerobacter sp.]|nr:PhoH family protein [Thermaerobacter sp.]